jgi:S-DNA-T family DNA segregation ATPase FtsK/SpoIIIE
MARTKKKLKKLPDMRLEKQVELAKKNRGIIAIVLFVLALLLLLPAFGLGGSAGSFAFNTLKAIAGIGYYLFPLLLVSLAVAFFREKEGYPTGKVVAGVLTFIAALGLVHLVREDGGGLLGSFIAFPFLYLFDLYATFLILAAVFIIAILVLFELELSPDSFKFMSISRLFSRGEKSEDDLTITGGNENEDDDLEPSPDESEPEPTPAAEQEKPLRIQERAKEDIGTDQSIKIRSSMSEYVAPPLILLEKDRGKPGTGDIKANANIIRRTMQNFGIQVEMDEVSIGPSVTRYAIKPAEGVRLSKIVSLQNNLELALAAHPVRIEAPIPGKSLVGIEVPNTSKATVGLASLFNSPDFAESGKPLLISLGRDIAGLAHFANIAKMPHLLIAGATGSGKSVAIHTLVTSLLFRNGPDELRFIMIDPKRVELTLYNGIPHLLTPVITDPKKTIMALKWAAKEMDRRYNVLEAESVRDIDSYHKNVYGPARAKKETELPEPMPYVVIVIDELADIMQSYPRELEAAIVRLAQMSRAVGIHLVLSTQRPSVNVITGLIKANVPARVALQVASQIDSRTILDGAGAEKLLGAGDMLYLSGDMGKPHRIQGAYIGEGEVKKVVDFIKKNNAGMLDSIELSGGQQVEQDGIFAGSSDDEEIDDDLYLEAKSVVEGTGKASTSYIQRKLRVGYARAARLIDMLEEKGIIGPADGSKPREVFSRSTTRDNEHTEQ